MTGAEQHDLPIEIGPSGRLRRVVRGGAVVLGVVGTLIVVIQLLGGDPSPWRLALSALQLVATMSAPVIMGLRTTVAVSAEGVEVIGHRQFAGRWAWDELLEVTIARQARIRAVGVRPRGSTWDVPGPTAPAVLTPAWRDAGQVEAVRRTVAALCAQHGVDYTETPAGLGSAPVGSPLRDATDGS